MDVLKYYELRNKLFHLDSNIDDELILYVVNLAKIQEIGKFADIIKVISISNVLSPDILQLSQDDIFTKCKNIVLKFTNLSNYNYSESDINKLTIFYYLKILDISEVAKKMGDQELIKLLEDIVVDQTDDLPQCEQFLNEELRIMLLKALQATPSHYGQNEDKILKHLEIAKSMVALRQHVDGLLQESW